MLSNVIKAFKARLFLVSLLSVSLLFSIAYGSTTVRIIDDIGRSVKVKLPVRRVISIQPSATEIIFALGAQKKLVGRTDFCDYPEGVKSIPSIGGLLNPSPDKIIVSRPQLILTSTMFPKAMAKPLMRAYPVIVLEPKDLMGVYNNILTLGRILQKQKEAEDLIASMDALRRPIEAYFQNYLNRPSVLTLVWHNPLITVGPTSFIASVIEIGGGRNYIQKDIGAYPIISPESLLLDEPDIILYPTKSMGIDPAFLNQTPFKNLKAVKTGRVFPFDDDLLFRPGPRVIQGMLEVSRSIDPSLKKTSIFTLSTVKNTLFKDGNILNLTVNMKNINGRIYVSKETMDLLIKNIAREIKVKDQNRGIVIFKDGKSLAINLVGGLFPLRHTLESLGGKIYWNNQYKEVYMFLK
ncbi:MAG: High-affinity heme uptake system protein IsdE [candidate division WS2 bacterium]|nr:High-affinity heme uptake system protein IsdE [Candidatus Lithacetigena glycinireducens]